VFIKAKGYVGHFGSIHLFNVRTNMDYPISESTTVGLVGGKFSDGDPLAGVAPSLDRAEDMNRVYDELIAVIVAAGITPSESIYTQLRDAIIALAAPLASTTVPGKIEIATTAETETGTDTDRAIPPAAAAAVYLKKGFMLVRDEKASGTNGGSTTAGATSTRTLNTVVANTISGASLASNQITLPAGTYRLIAHAPISGANLLKALLYNVTDSTVVSVGTSENASGNSESDIVTTASRVTARFTITASKVFEIRQYTQQTQNTSGFGDAVGAAGLVEVYTTVEIIKEA
jgi:hypothetical protein